MSINERIITAVQDLSILCCPWEEYEGSNDEKLSSYLVFNYTVVPFCDSDDEPIYEKYLIQLHYFGTASENTVSLRKKIKRAIHAAGFPWPSEENASDSDGQHYVFEFEALEAIDDGEV